MAYCTQSDMENLIPREVMVQLTDDESLGSVNAARLAEAIAQADAEADAYLARRYAVPVSPVPALLRKLSVDMAVYHLYSRTVHAMPEIRRERYTDAIKRLEAIARGTAGLGADATAAPASEQSPWAGQTNRTGDDHVFTREKMRGF